MAYFGWRRSNGPQEFDYLFRGCLNTDRLTRTKIVNTNKLCTLSCRAFKLEIRHAAGSNVPEEFDVFLTDNLNAEQLTFI